MVKVPRFMFAGGAVLAAALLVGGAVQAAPAPKARPHATRTQAKLTTAQAEAVAVKKFAGKVVGKTKLENEEGTWQYGVMVQSGKTLREVMVNAKTGKIDTVEVTNAATESREAKAEAAKAKPAPKAAATPKSAKATARTRHGTK